MTREVKIGSLKIGGGNRIAIQSMTNTRTDDIEATSAQITALARAGADLVRVAVPDMAAADAVGELVRRSPVPLSADIHFDYRLALRCVEQGIAKVRLNPGNIGDKHRVYEVADACAARGVPIRVGVNSGSVQRELLGKYGGPTADALCESALWHVKLLEECGFSDIVISLKSSSVRTTVASYRKLAALCDYPLHLGVTEAGTERMGVLKSAVGIGSLLLDGIGDTFRVSLTEDPVREIAAAKDILKAVGLGEGPELVCCPTCGRTRIDLIGLAKEVERRLSEVSLPIKVAVMGCAVNGPGEAREADIGIAGGDGKCILFKAGEIVASFPEEEAVDRLISEIKRMERR